MRTYLSKSKSISLGGIIFTIEYDVANRLVSVKVDGVTQASFVYDGDGNRVKSVIGATTTISIGSYAEKVGTTEKMYYYAGGTRVAMRSGSTRYFLLSDHLGSTTVTLTSSGSKYSELRYYPWGGVRYTSGTTPTARQYTGQVNDSTVAGGLMYYGARYFDSAVGRFISADTVVPGAGNAMAWDRYAYTFNSPVNYSDPNGHQPCRNGRTDCKNPHNEDSETNTNLDDVYDSEQSTDTPEEQLTNAERNGLVFSLVVTDIGLTAAEATFLIIGIVAAGSGPIGLVADVFIVAPVELLLVDAEISYSLYVQEVLENNSKEGIELELTIIPAILDLFR